MELSTTVTVDNSGNSVTVSIDHEELELIAKKVISNEKALSALKEGYEAKLLAKDRDEKSSPKPPTSYACLYEIMQESDYRLPGTLGTKIIKYLEERILTQGALND